MNLCAGISLYTSHDIYIYIMFFFTCIHPSLCHTITQQPSPHAIPSLFFFSPYPSVSPPNFHAVTFCLTCPPSYPVPLTVFVTHSSPTTSTPSPLLLALTDPMCALCSRSWGLKRSTSAHVGTGTKAPSAARRRKSLAEDSMD